MRAADAASRLGLKDPRPALVVGVCVYEAAAICTGKVPTITRLWHRYRDHRWARFGLWLLLGWLVDHLFREGHVLSVDLGE